MWDEAADRDADGIPDDCDICPDVFGEECGETGETGLSDSADDNDADSADDSGDSGL